jgi:hypothetical protein
MQVAWMLHFYFNLLTLNAHLYLYQNKVINNIIFLANYLNSTIAPDQSEYKNATSCHLSTTARNLYQSFKNQGVPKASGLDKAARVYYDWNDITENNLLTVYNG